MSLPICTEERESPSRQVRRQANRRAAKQFQAQAKLREREQRREALAARKKPAASRPPPVESRAVPGFDMRHDKYLHTQARGWRRFRWAIERPGQPCPKQWGTPSAPTCKAPQPRVMR